MTKTNTGEKEKEQGSKQGRKVKKKQLEKIFFQYRGIKDFATAVPRYRLGHHTAVSKPDTATALAKM